MKALAVVLMAVALAAALAAATAVAVGGTLSAWLFGVGSLGALAAAGMAWNDDGNGR